MSPLATCITLIVLLHYTCCSTLINYANRVTVDPQKGRDTENCISGQSPDQACQTLSWAFNSTHRKSSTLYILKRGTHFLNSTTDTFNETLSFLAFEGEAKDPRQVVIHCTAENTGLAFEGVKDISFMYLTFYNCSALRNSTSRDYGSMNSHAHSPVQFQVGLYFYLCANIIMKHVNVSDSPNATGVVMYDTNGTNQISDSVFQNNIISQHTTSTPSPHGGGGGFYVEFTYCKPGNTDCQDYQSYRKPVTGAWYYFTNCNFTNNQAYDSILNNGTYLIAFQSNHVAFGRGGGLSIFIKGESHNNAIEVKNCYFEGNSATWGGGMLIELQDYALNNSLTIIHTMFRNNTCQYSRDSGTYGGGLRVGHCVYLYNQTKQTIQEGNKISIESCNFYSNKGFNGGGLSLVVPRQNTTNSSSLAKINIIESIFAGNAARLGSALHIDGFALILFGLITEVNITSCEFENNSMQYIPGPELPENFIPYQDGLGAVYIHGVNVAFQGGVRFSKNRGSGLAAITTQLSFCDCSAIFSENYGTYGGGIALLGSAHLMINEKTSMEFVGNYGKLLGGAIYSTYISRENSQDYTHCIIRHANPFKSPDSWGAKFKFQGNMDLGHSRPNSIHTTSILPCSWAGGVGVNANKSAIFCWEGWSYTDSTEIPVDCASQLSTDAGKINFTTPHGKSEIEAFSGFPFNLQMNIMDDLNHDIQAETEFIAVTNTSGSTLGSKGDNYSYIWGESATVSGKEGDDIVLLLHTNDQRVWHLEMTVKLLPCPPGFKQPIVSQGNETSQLSCICSNGYGGAVICFIEYFHARLKNNNWMGHVDNESLEYLTAPCPPGYCHHSTTDSFVILPNNSINLESMICGSKNRQGILCGKCAPSFETAVNSPTYECVKCTNVNVAGRVFKYIAVIYIPIVVIFFVIMLFGIRLTSGPANAFIIYAQIISSTFNLNANGQIPLNLTLRKYKALVNAFRVPYGIFNLELLRNVVEPFCIGTGMDTLTVISLEYIVALLPLLMIVFAIAFMKIGNKIGENCNTNTAERNQMYISSASFIARRKRSLSESLLPTFAAFLLLSYTKFSLTSSYIMHQHHLIDENGTPVPPKRVYYSGHFTVNDKTYILLYFIPSMILFFVFVVMPPLLLLHYPILVFEWCLEKVQCLWRFYPATKVHIFLDTFQGCFKIKYHFFAGLYFLFRLVINTTIMLSEEWLQQCIIQLGVCIIMVMLVAICQPYNKENDIFNRVDVFIFANLAFINAISLYFYEYAITPIIARSIPTTFFAFQYILVFLPLFYMIVYVVWDRTKSCHKSWKKCVRRMTRKIFGRWKGNSYKLLENSTAEISINPSDSIPDPHLRYHPNINGALEDSEEVMFRRAELENTYRPRNRLVTIVETHGQEGEASLRHTTTSRDSGVRSVQSSPAYHHYGSTGERRASLHNYSGQNHKDGNGSMQDEGHKERHSTKSHKKADNSRPESDNRCKTT